MKNFELVVIKSSCLDNSWSERIADKFKKKLIISHFADSETYIDFNEWEKLKDKEVLLLAQFSFLRGCLVNQQLFELFFVVDKIKKSGAKNITLLSPYLPYSRQEVGINGNGLGFLDCLVNLFKSVGIHKIIVCDIHEPSILTKLSLEVVNIKLDLFWAEFIKGGILGDFENLKKETVLISPDRGGIPRVKNIASILKMPFGFVEKERIGIDKTKSSILHGDVAEKNVFLIDDIIDTAGTILNAHKILKEKGAKEIFGFFAHGIFSGDSLLKIEESGFNKLFITSTVLLSNKFSDKVKPLEKSDGKSSQKIFIVPVQDFVLEKI